MVNDRGAAVAAIEQAYAARFAVVADDLAHPRTVVVRGGDGAELAGRFRVMFFAELLGASASHPSRPRRTTCWAISYTSGTTGRSKAIPVPHAQAFTYAHWDERPLGPGTTTLVTLPMSHLSGQWFGLYQGLITGRDAWSGHVSRRRVLGRGPGARGQLHAAARRDGADTALRTERPDDADNPLAIACVLPLPPDLDLFCRRFGVQLATVFGMTEVGCPIVAPAGSVEAGGAGRERPGYRCKVVDENDLEVPPGVVGELLERPEVPATVMQGYHNLPEQTPRTFRNLWLHTGDAFSRDESGEFYFRDRIKDAPRRRGENVSSFEVESVVNGHPAVAESAVVAVPSEMTEDDLELAVVLQPGAALDPAELIEYLVPRIPYFTVPRYVEVLDELPKTPTQKVQKAVLRANGLTEGTWDREAHGITVGKD